MTRSPDIALARAQAKIARVNDMNPLHIRNWIPGPGLLTPHEFRAYDTSLKDSKRDLLYGSIPLIRGLKLGASIGAIVGLKIIPELVSFEWVTATKDLMQGDLLHTVLGVSDRIATPFVALGGDAAVALVGAMLGTMLGGIIGIESTILRGLSRVDDITDSL